MASAADFDGHIAAKAVLLSGTPSRMASDLLDSERIPEDGDRFQLSMNVGAVVFRSNETQDSVLASIRVLHRLGSAEAERTYRNGQMLINQAALVAPSWWEVASVQRILEAPVLQSEAERVGDVIAFTVTCTVALTP